MATSYCGLYNGIVLVRRSRSGVRAGVGVDISRSESESELESLEICRLRMPGYEVMTSPFHVWGILSPILYIGVE